MKTKASDPIASGVNPPDGCWNGTWGGYFARFEADGVAYQVRTDHILRCLAAPCTVTVKNGAIEVEAK